MQYQILLVDDDQYLRESVKSYLQEKGFQIILATNVSEAIQYLMKNIPDVLISDVVMPQISGYELINYVRSSDTLRDLPIILLTAKGMTQDRIKGYNLGCNAYLPKPFDPDELVSIINNLVFNKNSEQASISNQKLNELIVLASKSFALQFTPRELSVLRLVVRGLPNREIAQVLFTSKRNVEKYVSRLLAKTKTRNRTELAQYILRKQKVNTVE